MTSALAQYIVQDANSDAALLTKGVPIRIDGADLYLVFTAGADGGGGYLFNLEWFAFRP